MSKCISSTFFWADAIAFVEGDVQSSALPLLHAEFLHESLYPVRTEETEEKGHLQER